MPVVRAGRAAAERLMLDQIGIRRPTGATVTDPVTLKVTRVYDVIYEGKAKLQTYEGHEVTRDVVSATDVQQRSSVHFPVGALRTKPGDVVTVLSSVDTLLVGRSYRIVQDYPVKTHATAYRVFVDENVGEEVPPWPIPSP